MAENLNFDCPGAKCYGNDSKNAEKYGRLYDWETAKKACPPGWHLPSNEEWQTLVDFAGGTKFGDKLKAKSGWNGIGNGTDDFGFSALPGGNGLGDTFVTIGNDGNWWSVNEDGKYRAYICFMNHRSEYIDVGRVKSEKRFLFSVRCIQDKA
jgi:uncharacterized protein (TIGR02145 family)